MKKSYDDMIKDKGRRLVKNNIGYTLCVVLSSPILYNASYPVLRYVFLSVADFN